MGRKTVLTPDVQDKIISALSSGAFKKHAANAAGVGERTMNEWLRRGAEGEEPFATFAHEVDVAIARDALRNQAVISQAAVGKAAGDWKAAAWNLERKFPRLYGRAAELEQLIPLERPQSPWVKPVPSTEAAPKRARASEPPTNH